MSLLMFRQVPIPEETGGVAKDTKMPHAEPEVELPWGEQAGGEEPIGELEASEE